MLLIALFLLILVMLEERGMSQRAFARALGKTETEVSRWLSGTHNLTIATIAKMAAVLGDDIITATSSVKHETYQYSDSTTEATMVAEEVAEYGK